MKSLKALPLIAALFAFAFLIAAPDAAIASCRRGLKLCAELIVPSLFPFFVLSGLLNRLGLPSYIGKYLAPAASKLYGISGAGASALIVGLCGGYPMGAAYVADMRQSGAVSEQEAERLLAFCNNSGPAFIIGAIGAGVFRSGITGLQLYLIHILSALLTGLFFRDGSYSAESQPLLIDTELPTAAILDAVGQALRSILSVCGFVVCFSVLTGMLDAFGALSLLCGFLAHKAGAEPHFIRALLCGVLELGTGAGAMQGLAATPLNLSLAAGLVGFGGLSVRLQSKAVIADAKLGGRYLFWGRLLCGAISAILAYLLFR